MNGPELLTIFRDQLPQLVAEQNELQAPAPLGLSPCVAMSLLQKSIRRGHVDLALRATVTLLQDAPDRLWRRLGCIAFEDIGVADPETVSLVTAALSGRRVRSSVGENGPSVAFSCSG